MDELKPCPFCGESLLLELDREWRTGIKYWYVCCASCAAMVDSYTNDTRERAIAAWNRRAGEGE